MDTNIKRLNIQEVFNKSIYRPTTDTPYEWETAPVVKLLGAILAGFENGCTPCELGLISVKRIGQHILVIDGLQRLTTLSLILMKLRNMALLRGSDKAELLNSLITGIRGKKQYYWMDYPAYADTMTDIYDNGMDAVPHDASKTATNMVVNYKVIDSYLETNLLEEDTPRFEAFLSYFIEKVYILKESGQK